MRSSRRALSIVAAALSAAVAVTGCGSPPPTRGVWQGPDVHLVDGTWIGTESACQGGNVECRTVVDLGLRTLEPTLRARVVAARFAMLPSEFRTSSGETWRAHVNIGIESVRAIVVELSDGSVKVIGLICHLPYGGVTLMVQDAECRPFPLDQWLDGHLPETPAPGTVFG